MKNTLYGDDSMSGEFVHGEYCWCYSSIQECNISLMTKLNIYLPGLDEEQLFDFKKDPG